MDTIWPLQTRNRTCKCNGTVPHMCIPYSKYGPHTENKTTCTRVLSTHRQASKTLLVIRTPLMKTECRLYMQLYCLQVSLQWKCTANKKVNARTVHTSTGFKSTSRQPYIAYSQHRIDERIGSLVDLLFPWSARNGLSNSAWKNRIRNKILSPLRSFILIVSNLTSVK